MSLVGATANNSSPDMPQCLCAWTSRTHFFKYPKKNLYDCDLEAQSILF